MIDEPNFSNSGGTVLTDEKDVHGSGPQWSSSLDLYIGRPRRATGCLEQSIDRCSGRLCKCSQKTNLVEADPSRGILAWVPVGVFFTRHVYSFASITGSSMQVSHQLLDLRI